MDDDDGGDDDDDGNSNLSSNWDSEVGFWDPDRTIQIWIWKSDELRTEVE